MMVGLVQTLDYTSTTIIILAKLCGLNDFWYFTGVIFESTTGCIKARRNEQLNAGIICDWFQKDKEKREKDFDSATLKW